MKTRHLIIALTALTVTIGSNAVAQGIYKWTDADGNVHYEDRPSGDPSEELINVVYNRTSNSAVQGRVQNRLDSQASRNEANAVAEQEAAAAAEQAAEADDRKKKCTSYRAKLQTMLQSNRLYREDENGERVYLDDSQRAESRQRAEELIQEYCNS